MKPEETDPNLDGCVVINPVPPEEQKNCCREATVNSCKAASSYLSTVKFRMNRRSDRPNGPGCRHAAAGLSSLSAPRITILSASSGKGRCNALASSHGARIQTSR